MEFKQVVENRASVRKFKPEKISKNDLKELVRIACLAPSVNNFQPWKFVVITNKELLSKMARKVGEKISEIPVNRSKVSPNVKSQVEYFSTFFENAPSVIAVAMEEYESVLEKAANISHDEINKMRNYPDIQSLGAAIQNILLAAVDLGLGACWLSAPMMAKQELEEMISLDNHYRLVAFVAVGKPEKQPVPRMKKALDDVICFME